MLWDNILKPYFKKILLDTWLQEAWKWSKTLDVNKWDNDRQTHTPNSNNERRITCEFFIKRKLSVFFKEGYKNQEQIEMQGVKETPDSMVWQWVHVFGVLPLIQIHSHHNKI